MTTTQKIIFTPAAQQDTTATPKALNTSELRELYEGALINLEQTAAERDRRWRAYMTTKRERDQAREQVQALLAACKRVGDRAMWRSLNGELVWLGETPDGNEIETQHPVSILQAAIASVESEEAK